MRWLLVSVLPVGWAPDLPTASASMGLRLLSIGCATRSPRAKRPIIAAAGVITSDDGVIVDRASLHRSYLRLHGCYRPSSPLFGCQLNRARTPSWRYARPSATSLLPPARIAAAPLGVFFLLGSYCKRATRPRISSFRGDRRRQSPRVGIRVWWLVIRGSRPAAGASGCWCRSLQDPVRRTGSRRRQRT